MKLLEDFITKFKDKNYQLTIENSHEYHRLHGVLLYFIYLLFLMYQNIKYVLEGRKLLENIEGGIYENHIQLADSRLAYFQNLSVSNFDKYSKRLDSLFYLF